MQLVLQTPNRFLFFAGKGGVGKTTIKAAIAIGLVKRGHSVHLTTTDPAAHVALVVDSTLPGLTVDRIDPAAETARYVEQIMATKGRDLDEAGGGRCSARISPRPVPRARRCFTPSRGSWPRRAVLLS